MKPCPICGCKKVQEKNCGYSTFDPTWYECPDCGFKVGICFVKDGDVIADSWADGCEKAKTIMELPTKQIKALDLEDEYKSLTDKKKAFLKQKKAKPK